MVKSWLEDAELGSAIESLLGDHAPVVRERIAALARRAGASRDTWRAFQKDDVLVFREEFGSESLVLLVDRRRNHIRLELASDVDATGELPVENFDEAVDGIVAPVLSWLRSRGEMPRGASRLAALFEPRRRGTAWPSSPS